MSSGDFAGANKLERFDTDQKQYYAKRLLDEPIIP